MREHPLRPRTRHSLGEPLPHQQADRTWTPPRAAGPFRDPHLSSRAMRPGNVSGISSTFDELYRSRGQVVQALLTLPPLYSPIEIGFLARLACLIHAASVRSEPVSYPPVERLSTRFRTLRREIAVLSFLDRSSRSQRDLLHNLTPQGYHLVKELCQRAFTHQRLIIIAYPTGMSTPIFPRHDGPRSGRPFPSPRPGEPASPGPSISISSSIPISFPPRPSSPTRPPPSLPRWSRGLCTTRAAAPSPLPPHSGLGIGGEPTDPGGLRRRLPSYAASRLPCPPRPTPSCYPTLLFMARARSPNPESRIQNRESPRAPPIIRPSAVRRTSRVTQRYHPPSPIGHGDARALRVVKDVGCHEETGLGVLCVPAPHWAAGCHRVPHVDWPASGVAKRQHVVRLHRPSG